MSKDLFGHPIAAEPPRSADITRELRLHDETPLSILVSRPVPGQPRRWLPRSQIAFEPAGTGLVKVTLPQWLAVREGLD